MHGQAEPACFLFTLAAFVIVLRAGPQVSGRLTGAAGILLGLAIATQTWPVVFGPALLLALPSWRRRAQFAAGAAGVMAPLFASLPVTVGTPVAKLPYIATQFVETRPSQSRRHRVHDRRLAMAPAAMASTPAAAAS